MFTKAKKSSNWKKAKFKFKIKFEKKEQFLKYFITLLI